MSKLFSSMLLAIALISNFAYAETIKSAKKTKSTDTNKTMSNEEFMKQFMAIEQRKKDAIKKGETLDEINKLLGVDKQK